MKADPKTQHGILALAVLMLPLILAGCLDGDAQLQQAVRDLRTEVQRAKEANQTLAAQLGEAKTKIKEMEGKVEAADGSKSVAVHPDRSAELKAALEKIAELETLLSAAETGAKPASLTAASLRELAKELQADLMSKVNELSDLVQAKIPSADLQEVTVKRIHPPEEVASAFTSAITFTFMDGNRQPVPLRFPVQAGLDGSWRVPTVEDVQRVFNGVASGEVQVSTPTPGLASSPQQGSPAGAAAGNAPTQSLAARPTFDKQADGSIVINWDSNAVPPSGSALAPVAPTPAPTPAASSPAQAATPPPAAPQKPSMPAPVMPVQQDIIVRFD